MNNQWDAVQWATTVLEKVEKKYAQVTSRTNTGFFPYTTKNGRFVPHHSDDKYTWWTNGFYPGILWLLYLESGKEQYKDLASYYEEFLDVILKNSEEMDHDVGFRWLTSSVAGYRITQNMQSRKRGLHAADILASRFNIRGNFLRAWNGSGNEGWAIIDSMMNLPILYWASEETEDPRYRHIAEAHARKALEYFIRPDGSVNHILSFDPMTGEYIENFAGQGYSVNSSWTRGQAWAIYGFTLSYLHTGEAQYLDAAKRVSHYFIACMQAEEDYVPPCDFRSPHAPVYKDTTAGAIAACGLLEIAKVVPVMEQPLYQSQAVKLLQAIESGYCNWNMEEDNILEKGTERYGEGVNIPIIYGDYYFIEALMKIKGNGVFFW